MLYIPPAAYATYQAYKIFFARYSVLVIGRHEQDESFEDVWCVNSPWGKKKNRTPATNLDKTLDEDQCAIFFERPAFRRNRAAFLAPS